jgi:hypothetical protein
MRVVIPTFFLLLATGCAADEASDVNDPSFSSSEQHIGVIPTGTTCKEAGLGVQHLTLNNPAEGEYVIDPMNSFTLGYYDESHTVFYFTQSTIRMTGVLVTSGGRTMMWEMPGGADGWPSLQGPPDELTGEAPRPDQVTFCFDYELYVQPSPYANYAQRATWNLSKTASVSTMFLAEGQSANVDFHVTASPGPVIPAGQFIDGPVFVENKSPFTVSVSKVKTMVGTINAAVTCPRATPFTLAPYETLECSFMATVPTTADRNVVGSGVVNKELKVTTIEVMASFSSHNVATRLFDRCAFLFDDFAPYNDHFLGTACREDGPQTFDFTAEIGPFPCGKFASTSTASYTGIDNRSAGTTRWQINGLVTCDPRPR